MNKIPNDGEPKLSPGPRRIVPESSLNLSATIPEITITRPLPHDVQLRKEIADLAVRQARKANVAKGPKVVFFIGRGSTGKTTNIRFLIREMERKSMDFGIIDADASNPVLHQYIEDCHEPPNLDEDESVHWLAEHILSTVEDGFNALIDLGGGDTRLGRLLMTISDFVQQIEERGGGVIAICTLGPSADYLMPIVHLERLGFRPTATVLLLNEATLATKTLGSRSFSDILTHSYYEKLINTNNAVPLLIPSLSIIGAIEKRRMGFEVAKKGLAAPGAPPLSSAERLILGDWLRKMERIYEPIMAWFEPVVGEPA